MNIEQLVVPGVITVMATFMLVLGGVALFVRGAKPTSAPKGGSK